MDLENKYRLRVESCIGTIIDVHQSISSPYENEDFISRFYELRDSIDDMDMSGVSDRDIRLVEQATNALLGEFRSIFETGDHGFINKKRSH
ncbi:MAG: hypothetical protein JRC68_06810 [Deltaproteobacteria bacterium]|nr:hypothetical protein [Deltaproteobacteria bacterium]